MAGKKTSKKTTVETVEKTEKTTTTIDFLAEELDAGMKYQRENSIFVNFDESPQVFAVTGAALWERVYQKGPDLNLGLRVVPKDNQDKVQIIQIRSFGKKSLAFLEAAKILKAAGMVITEVGDSTTKPNLKDFKWVAVEEAKIPIVVITPREFNGRWWPNRVNIYKPPEQKLPKSGNMLDIEEVE